MTQIGIVGEGPSGVEVIPLGRSPGITRIPQLKITPICDAALYSVLKIDLLS